MPRHHPRRLRPRRLRPLRPRRPRSVATRGAATWATTKSASAWVSTPVGQRDVLDAQLVADGEAPTRRSRSTTGMLPGMASTVRWKSSCSSRPPSFTPVASPTRWIGISALTATSRSMRMKSTCTRIALGGVAVDLAGEREHALAVDVEGDQRVGARLAGEDVLQLAGGHGDRDGVGAEAVDDGRHLALTAEAAGGARSRGRCAARRARVVSGMAEQGLSAVRDAPERGTRTV